MKVVKVVGVKDKVTVGNVKKVIKDLVVRVYLDVYLRELIVLQVVQNVKEKFVLNAFLVNIRNLGMTV